MWVEAGAVRPLPILLARIPGEGKARWGYVYSTDQCSLLLCLPFQLLSNQPPAEANPASTRATCSSRVGCACSLLAVAIVAWSPDCTHCVLEHSSVDGGGGRHGKNHGLLIILLPTKTFCAFL